MDRLGEPERSPRASRASSPIVRTASCPATCLAAIYRSTAAVVFKMGSGAATSVAASRCRCSVDRRRIVRLISRRISHVAGSHQPVRADKRLGRRAVATDQTGSALPPILRLGRRSAAGPRSAVTPCSSKQVEIEHLVRVAESQRAGGNAGLAGAGETPGQFAAESNAGRSRGRSRPRSPRTAISCPALAARIGFGRHREQRIGHGPGRTHAKLAGQLDEPGADGIQTARLMLVVMIDVELQIDRQNQRPRLLAAAHRQSFPAPASLAFLAPLIVNHRPGTNERLNAAAGGPLQSLQGA